MSESSERVKRGDLVKADLMNWILDKLDSLDTKVTGLAAEYVMLQLGQLAQDTHTLVALGTGFESGGGIWLDGQPLLAGSPGRGVNLVILDSNLNLKHRETYDTYGSATQSNQLAADLFSMASHYDVVAAVTHDAYARQLTASAQTALAAVGGQALATTEHERDNAAFIGVAPANLTNARFNYLTSVVPADGAGTGSARLAGLPFAWGVYSKPLKRFLLGGATDNQAAAPAPQPTIPTITIPTFTIPTLTTPTFTIPTATIPTMTITIPTATIPTMTITIPTATIVPTLPTATVAFSPTFPTVTIVPTLPTATIAPTLPTATIAPTLATVTIAPTLPTATFAPTGPIVTATFAPTLPSASFVPVAPVVPVSPFDLHVEPAAQPVTDVRGIGPRRAELLEAEGITTLGTLVAAPVPEVAAILGLSENQVEDLMAEARNLLGAP